MRRLITPAILLSLAALPASAQQSERDAALAPFFSCESIVDNLERLTCFDRAVTAARGGAAMAGDMESPAPAAPSSMAEAPQQTPAAQPAPAPRAEAPEHNDTGTYRVAGSVETAAGFWVIVMDNGMRWRLTETSPTFRPPEHGDTIEIKRSMMGGRKLYFGKQPSVRVQLME